MIAELDDAGNTRVAYGWQPDTMYGGTAPLWQANIATGKTLQTADYHYIITDHLGTPIMTVNKEGQVTWQALTEAFGKTMPNAQNQITMNLRFPGQYYDAETGTHYNYFRDYNPQTGRYIQRDPIGLGGGINTYKYVNGNPLIYSDVFGLQAQPNYSPGPSPSPLPEGTPGRIPTEGLPPAANDASFASQAGRLILACARLSVGAILMTWPETAGNACYDTTPKPAECYNDEDCSDITAKIEAQKRIVARRYHSLRADIHNLFSDPYRKFSNTKGSWFGHVEQYYNQQKRLNKLIDEAIARNCHVDPVALYWSQQPAPAQPDPKP